jgi:hypothetical protein
VTAFDVITQIDGFLFALEYSFSLQDFPASLIPLLTPVQTASPNNPPRTPRKSTPTRANADAQYVSCVSIDGTEEGGKSGRRVVRVGRR